MVNEFFLVIWEKNDRIFALQLHKKEQERESFRIYPKKQTFSFPIIEEKRKK